MDKLNEDIIESNECDYLSVLSAVDPCKKTDFEDVNNALVDTSTEKRRVIQTEDNENQSPRLSLNLSKFLEEEGNIGDKLDLLSIQDADYYTDIIFQQDEDGDNLLFISIIDKQISLTLGLISLVCDVHCFSVCNKLMQTALHLATLNNMPKIVRRLIIAGANVDQRDQNGNTALHIACENGFLDVAEMLLRPVTYQEIKLNSYEIPYQQIPQNLEIRNSLGMTCLHLAVLDRNESMIGLLLSRDADINSVEMKSGKTCLHIAAECGDTVTVFNLLNCNQLEIDKETFSGYTANELARYRGHKVVEIVLTTAGASPPRPIETVEHSRVFNERSADGEHVEITEISSDDDDNV